MLQKLRVLLAVLTALSTIGVVPCTPAATLSGALTPLLPGTVIDLTAQGSSDWAHWGLDTKNLFDQKLSATQRISTFTLIGTAAAQPEAASLIGYRSEERRVGKECRSR